MELKVYNTQGKATGKKVKLADSVYGVEPNDHAIYLDVKQHLANKRQGTHKAKERSEIAGSSKKIKKQKELVVHELEMQNQELEWWWKHLVQDQEITISR